MKLEPTFARVGSLVSIRLFGLRYCRAGTRWRLTFCGMVLAEGGEGMKAWG